MGVFILNNLIAMLACSTQCCQVRPAHLQHAVLSGHHRLYGSPRPLQPAAEPPHSDGRAQFSTQCYQVIIVVMDHFGLCSQQQNHHILISKLACRTQCYQVIIVVMDHFGVSSQQQNHSDSHARLQHTVLSGHHRLHGSLCPLQPTAEPPHSDSHARLKHTVLSGHHRLHCSLRSLQLVAEPPHSDGRAHLQHTVLSGHHRLHG